MVWAVVLRAMKLDNHLFLFKLFVFSQSIRLNEILGGGRQCAEVECSKVLSPGSDIYCFAHGNDASAWQQAPYFWTSCHARPVFFFSFSISWFLSFNHLLLTYLMRNYACKGGGKRCSIPDCAKLAIGPLELCVAHGGGYRCSIDRCGKGAKTKEQLCGAHGGGKR